MDDLKHDLIAGLSVFLLALPLCLGIALASQFPPSAGIITAIAGGIITSFLSGAKLTIKGPAAGLIVIVSASVIELGQGDLFTGYKRTLAVGVVAALLQIILAVRKKAIFAEMMPPSVIHGMLSAIGVIIIAKQSYVLIGTRPETTGIFNLLIAFPLQLANSNPIILTIGVLTLGLVLFWPKIKKLNSIPATIIVIALTIPISVYFHIQDTHTYHLFYNDYILDHSMLVSLPNHFLHAIHFPDFSHVLSFTSLKYILMFTLVGSIESLLTACAVDSITKPEKEADLNKDLLGLGIANLCTSFIGGLPMIAEIVRSKANIEYGAKSAKSNLFHGLFMLIAALALTPYINLIPLSALAALLIYVGFKLASPKAFIYAYKVGKDQFLIFMATFIITLLLDLLTGVIAGVLLELLIHLFRGNNLNNLFKPMVRLEQSTEATTIIAGGALTFAGYLKLKHMIAQALKKNNPVIIDLSNTHFVDHAIMAKLHSLKELTRNTLFIITGTGHLKPFSEHNLSSRKAMV